MKRIRSIVFSVLGFLFLSVPSYSQSKLDSLIKLSKTAKADTHRVILFNNIAKECTALKKYDQANQYSREALAFSEKLNYRRGIANANYFMGYNYYKQGNNTEGIKYMAKSLELYELAQYKYAIGQAAGNIGNAYYKMDIYPKSLEYYLKAIKVYEETNSKSFVAGYSGNVGAIYNNMKDNEKALEFYQKSLKLNEELKSEQGIAINYVCIANVYNDQKKYKEALDYYEKALVINEKIGNKAYIANNLGNIGLVKTNLKDFKGALEALTDALNKERELADEVSAVTIERNIGDLYYEMKNFTEAENYYKQSLTSAQKINSLRLQKDLYHSLYLLYQATGQYELSLENYKNFIPLKDSLLGISNQKAVLQQQMQFDFEKKEATTKAEFEKEQSEKQLEIEKRKQAMVLLEKDNALQQLNLSQSELKLKEEQAQSEVSKRQVEILNKDKLLQDAEALKKAEELEQQKLLRNIFIAGAVVLLCFAFFILRSLAQSRRSNKIIEKQKLEVEHQKHMVEEKQKEIVDSINYAQRIQYALLANKKVLDENLASTGSAAGDYFLLFKPKDVVSGDFYWAATVGNQQNSVSNESETLPSANGHLFYLATADSTGHGVPGAIMSILNIACLNEAVKSAQLTGPAGILNETRNKVISHLLNDGSTEGGKDGMDCSLVCFDFKNLKLIYAAANNPVWIVRENKLIVLPADKMPVGKHDKDHIPFSQTEVPLQKGDVVYTFTDGYADQFGGAKGKKFKYKQLEELVISINNKPMQQQHDMLLHSFNTWKGDLEQVDDVCVIGVRI